MNCTVQMLYCHEDLLRPREACNCRLQSADESCPIRAKTRRSDSRIPFCSHPKGGKNPQSHLASSGTLSNLRQQFSDHSTLQIRPNHQDWFCTLHWSLYRTGKFRHSSYNLTKEQSVKREQHFSNITSSFSWKEQILFSKWSSDSCYDFLTKLRLTSLFTDWTLLSHTRKRLADRTNNSEKKTTLAE